MNKNLKIGIITSVILLLLIIGGIILTGKKSNTKVVDFDSCVKSNNGIILETYPATCNYQGKTFRQPITSEDAKKLIPPSIK